MPRSRRSAFLSPGTLAAFVLLLPGHPGQALHAQSPTSPQVRPDGSPPPLPAAPAVGSLYLSAERFALEEGGRGTAERGVLFVPAVRGDPASGLVALEFWRFPAEAGAPAGLPPVFELEGGPGFGGLGSRIHDGDGYYEKWIRPFTRRTDYVSVGQRGFGASKPDTRCAGSPDPLFDPRRPLEERKAAVRRAAEECRRFWEDRGVRLEGLNVIEAADDVAAVADALGYDSVALWGVSFGSHWAMAVMRRHPDLVARAVLAGLEGPDHTYDMPSGVLRSLERAAADAEASPELRQRIPEGGLLAALRETVERLDREPVFVDVTLEREGGEGDGGPGSGMAADTAGAAAGEDGGVGEDGGAGGERRVRVRIDGNLVRAVADDGYTDPPEGSHRLAAWPADILTLHAGDYDALARDAADDWQGYSYIPSAAYFTYDCGSGISAGRWAELSRDPAVELIGSQTWLYEGGCPAFDVDLGERFRTGFSTDVPTVLVHGTWDTSTPFENALELEPSFRSGRLIPVERGTHGLVFRSFQPDGPETLRDLREALIDFLVRGAETGLPDRVVLPPVGWTVPE